MQPLELFQVFTAPLETLGIDYFVTGSVAGLIYGEPRVTHDIDIVLVLRDAEARRLLAAFPEEQFYSPPLEVLRVELRRASGGHFNLIHHDSGFKADMYLARSNPLHAWAFERRRRSGTGEGAFWVAPPEYVIVRKLEYFREGGSEKHLRDIRAMVAQLGESLDQAALDQWIAAKGLGPEWKQAAP